MCYYIHFTKGGYDLSTATQSVRSKKDANPGPFAPIWAHAIECLKILAGFSPNPNQVLHFYLPRRAVLIRQQHSLQRGRVLESIWRRAARPFIGMLFLPFVSLAESGQKEVKGIRTQLAPPSGLLRLAAGLQMVIGSLCSINGLQRGDWHEPVGHHPEKRPTPSYLTGENLVSIVSSTMLWERW